MRLLSAAKGKVKVVEDNDSDSVQVVFGADVNVAEQTEVQKKTNKVFQDEELSIQICFVF